MSSNFLVGLLEPIKGYLKTKMGNGLSGEKTYLNIGRIYTFADISEEQKYATSGIHLKAIATCLQAWFEDN